jgi:hypothetical protein
MTKVGLKTKKIDAKVIEFEHLGVKREALLIMPYGMMANAPDESFVVSFCQDGNDDSLICYPFDAENIDELEENEVAFGIPLKKARLKFLESGEALLYGDKNIDIKSDSDVNIDSENIVLQSGSDFACRFNELEARLADLENNLNALTVNIVGVQAGASTITSSVPLVPSNVDFSNVKVSTVQLPTLAEETA